MTEHQETFDVIAAFADGERVDTSELRAALADEAGREYLIDLVAMREIVGDVDLAATAPARPTGSRTRTIVGLAAALAMAVGVAGYTIGQQRSHIVPMAVLPPLEADAVVALEPPPAPTQVIPLRGGRSDEGR